MSATVDKDISLDRAHDLLMAEGYLIVRDAVEREVIDALRREFRPFLDASVNCRDEEQGTSTKRFKGAFIKARAYPRFAMNPLLTAMADRVLLPNCANYVLSGSSCFEVGPGAGFQPLHRDDVIWPMPKPRPEIMLQVMCAISDFTEENGATRIVPDSHLWPEARKPRQEDAISAVMPSGSVAFILGSTYHGAGRNTTADVYRMSVSASYALGWVRQQDNQYLFAPPRVARKLPDAFARLIGYQSHPPHLGQVDIERDLHEVLDPSSDAWLTPNAWD